MKISIIGAGNGGQAMAGHFALLGHEITLYNISKEAVRPIFETKQIALNDKITGLASLHHVTDNIEEAIKDAEVVMITTTANAHRELAVKMAAFAQDGQIFVLNPGRTLGAFEFYQNIHQFTDKKIYVAEAQTLIYACRADTPGNVRIIGIKDKVMLAAYPTCDTNFVIKKVNGIFSCFVPAQNVLHTSLENIGAILHPSVMLFNASAIERGNLFYFYNDITPAVTHFISELDKERLKIGEKFNIKLLSVEDWVAYAYADIVGNNLYEKMKDNPAYYKILAPNTLKTRLLTEDIPTGLIPMCELAKIAGVQTPLMQGLINISKTMIEPHWIENARTMEKLGLSHISYHTFFNLFIKNRFNE